LSEKIIDSLVAVSYCIADFSSVAFYSAYCLFKFYEDKIPRSICKSSIYLGCSSSGAGINSFYLGSCNFTPPITIFICRVFRAESKTFLPDEFSLSGLFLLEVKTLITP